MQCPSYLNYGLPLFRATRHLHPLNVNTLLYQRDNLADEENVSLIIRIQSYIKTLNVILNNRSAIFK